MTNSANCRASGRGITGMGKVALDNSIILIKKDPQIALCQVELAFSEQLGQK